MLLAASFWRIALQVLGYLSIGLIVASVILMIRSLRRDQRIRLRVLLLPVAAAVLTLGIYAAVLKVAIIGPLSWPLLIAGLALGVAASRATKLRAGPQGVLGKRSIWHLVVWGLTFALTQALAMSRSAQTVAYGLSSIFFSTGLTSGTNLGLLVSYLALRGEPETVLAPSAALQAEAPAGSAAAAGMTPTALPVAHSGDAARPAGTNAVSCAVCGQPIAAGARFCSGCGSALAAS